ncbi:MAG: DUF1501 domain-containing protein [Planctomycetales bacterium]
MTVRCHDPRHALGVSRREVLQVGWSALAGLGLGQVLAAQGAASPASVAARAKHVVLVFLSGGASHHDTFDLKPQAPVEIRGDFQPISTPVPGIQVCEHLPRLAQRADRLAFVRSMAHREFNHLPATHQVLTGALAPNASGSDLDRVASRKDFPCYAAALELLHPRRDGIPSGVALPTHLVEGPLTWPGQNAGCLGAQFDPWQIKDDPNGANFREESLSLPTGFTLDRVEARRTLLSRFNGERDRLEALADRGQFSEKQQLALDMLTSGKVARAFELAHEPDALRERYGRHLFGQSLLLARRLLQAGVPIVQANMGIVQTWDTHVENFPKLKDRLLPPLDQAVSALLDDLSAIGLLDETLVIITGEFGRTPRISTLPGEAIPGRDHWCPVFTSVFAGGGVQGGQVIGRSDDIGAYPVTRTYSLQDLGATVYQALGVDPVTELHDQTGRPFQANRGEPMTPLYTGNEI